MAAEPAAVATRTGTVAAATPAAGHPSEAESVRLRRWGLIAACVSGLPRPTGDQTERDDDLLPGLSRQRPEPSAAAVVQRRLDIRVPTPKAGEGVIPHCCPVCGGRGTVPPDFYSQLGQSTSAARESCRSCAGTGIVWDAWSPQPAAPQPAPLQPWSPLTPTAPWPYGPNWTIEPPNWTPTFEPKIIC